MNTRIVFFCCFICVFFCERLYAQPNITLSTGPAKDLNNTNYEFYYLPVAVQWNPGNKKSHPFFAEISYGQTFNVSNSGTAYTLHPSLPPSETLKESIYANIATFNLGGRIRVGRPNRKSDVNIILTAGICSQNFKVTYKNYDKTNYEVLNPDVNTNMSGAVEGFGIEYHFSVHHSVRLYAQTPLLIIRGDYPLSFRSIGSVQLAYGYKFYYKKRK
ncbi:MAG TPA: hypothetical protein VG847_00355 [Chitinophagaceae bacterium]|nr:hypothetical protein [Chitinophagaceae bacterium]